MKCPKCNKNISDNVNYCCFCGYSFENKNNEEYFEFYKSAQDKDNNSEKLDLYRQVLSEEKISPNDVNDKFNWGAFLWGWIWAIRYNPLLAFVDLLLTLIVPFTFGILCLIFRIYLGMYGNRIAWKSRLYRDTFEFHDIQKRWVLTYLIIFVSTFLISFTIYLCIAFGLASQNNDDNNTKQEKVVQPVKKQSKQLSSSYVPQYTYETPEIEYNYNQTQPVQHTTTYETYTIPDYMETPKSVEYVD